jgi:two-component sensor histidine kinase
MSPLAAKRARQFNIRAGNHYGAPRFLLQQQVRKVIAQVLKILLELNISTTGHLLSVSDDGPGLSAAYDPGRSKGLGMKIIQTLVKQIGGALQFAPGDGGRGTRVTVAFGP